jgi:hypothetical protein
LLENVNGARVGGLIDDAGELIAAIMRQAHIFKEDSITLDLLLLSTV